jgi:hypothetical protein
MISYKYTKLWFLRGSEIAKIRFLLVGRWSYDLESGNKRHIW